MAQFFYKSGSEYLRKRDNETGGASFNTDLVVIERDVDVNSSLAKATREGRPYQFVTAKNFYDALLEVKKNIGIK